MFSRLALRLPIMPEEPPAQYAFRLAARNFMEVRPFSLDMGINFERLLSGCPTALQRLAEVSGTSLPDLARNACQRNGYNLLFKGQTLDCNSMRCGRIVVCPQCLKDDIANSNLPPAMAMHSRFEWALSSIRTCRNHNLALVTVAERLGQRDRQNWSVRKLENELSSLIDGAVRRSPSTYEVYLLDRLNGEPTDCWLDNLDFFAAEQAAQLFGTFAVCRDNTPPQRLGDAEVHAAGEAAFEIFKADGAGITAFLDRVQREFSHKVNKRDRTLGAPTIYGRIHTRLSALSKNAAFAPLTDIVADHIVSKFPIGPGDTLFHKPVRIRKLHSVLTLSRQFGISEKRTIKVLQTGGLLPCPDVIDRDAIFDAASAEDLIRSETQGLTQAKAEEYLNVPKNLMESLIKIGMIRRYRHSTGFHGYRFSKAELDEFLARLLKDAVPVHVDAEGLLSIGRASFHCRAKVSDIIQLIFDRKLPRVGHRPDLAGVQSIVVYPEDVKNARGYPDLAGMNAVTAGAKLRINPRVIRVLIERGFLAASKIKNPINNRPAFRIDPSELDRFDAEYTTAFNLARLQKQDVVKIQNSLAAKGVHPVEGLSDTESTFYRRSDLQ